MDSSARGGRPTFSTGRVRVGTGLGRVRSGVVATIRPEGRGLPRKELVDGPERLVLQARVDLPRRAWPSAGGIGPRFGSSDCRRSAHELGGRRLRRRTVRGWGWALLGLAAAREQGDATDTQDDQHSQQDRRQDAARVVARTATRRRGRLRGATNRNGCRWRSGSAFRTGRRVGGVP